MTDTRNIGRDEGRLERLVRAMPPEYVEACGYSHAQEFYERPKSFLARLLTLNPGHWSRRFLIVPFARTSLAIPKQTLDRDGLSAMPDKGSLGRQSTRGAK